MTGYVVAGVVFWVFCFGMSRYSQMLERRLAARRAARRQGRRLSAGPCGALLYGMKSAIFLTTMSSTPWKPW